METSHWQRYYRQAIETLHYEGLYVLLWRTLVKCFSPLGSLVLVTFCQKDLTQPLGEVRAKGDVTISQATESDIEQLTTLEASRDGPKANKKLDFLRDKIHQRIRRGNKCFVAKIDTEIVHYNWISLHRVESVYKTGLFMNLRDDEAYCENAYTAEAWRGKAIHTAVNNQMLLFLQQAGYRRAYTVVRTDNRSSKKTHHRLDWEFSGTMLYFISKRAKKLWIWRIKGTLDPFVKKKIPAHEA